MKYNKYLYLFFIFLPLMLLSQTKGILVIHNNSDLVRNETLVSIKWETILEFYPQIDTSNFVVINALTNKQVPYQLEYKGETRIQNLLVQVSVKAKSSLRLFIKKGKPIAFKTQTYARYVPERFDDFAWENDRIAFRAYGKALEGTKDNAYGLDVWVKRTDKMIVNERYKLGEYHVDHGNGLDYYKVGFTLGAGFMAPYINDTVRYSANYHRWKVLDNGPLRSSFLLEYDSWDAAGIKIKCSRTISLDAGSQFNRIEDLYSYEGDKALAVAVGIAKRPENGILLFNEQQGSMGYWEPAHGVDGTTGVASVLTTTVKKMRLDDDQLLAITEAKNNVPIVYYAGAVWDKAGKITNSTQWFSYFDNFAQELKNPLIVNVK